MTLNVVWKKCRALDEEHGLALWPAYHPVSELRELRAFDATSFSREYQNDPVDDAASMFPMTLTTPALDPSLTFLPVYRKNPSQEYVVGGYDVAASAEIGADYAVLIIAAVDRETGRRRILHGSRHKGLGFSEQIDLLRSACRDFEIDLLIVEQNGLQRWLKTELERYPETARCVLGHTTGQEKGDLTTGVPSLKIGLANGVWTMPSGDRVSAGFAITWQAEMAAFGWRDGKLMGRGSHDDCVMAFYFLDRSARLVERWTHEEPEYEIVYAEELGFKPVKIGSDY